MKLTYPSNQWDKNVLPPSELEGDAKECWYRDRLSELRNDRRRLEAQNVRLESLVEAFRATLNVFDTGNQ